MKNNLYLILFFIMVSSANAQDLIVTKKNDSINAQITKTKKEFLYFRFVKDGKVRNTLLSKEEIKEYKKDFYKTSDIPNDYKIKKNKDFSRFRFALQGGLANNTAKISKDIDPLLKDHLKELKSGFSYGADFYYFFSEPVGLGLRYDQFYSNNVEQNIHITYNDNPGVREYGLKSDIDVTFIGPSIASKFNFGKTEKNQLFFAFGIGYLSFKNKEQSGNRYSEITGETVGLNYDLEYNYKIYKNLLLGVQLSYLIGTLGEVEIEENGNTTKVEFEKDSKESLNRLNFSLGLRLELD